MSEVLDHCPYCTRPYSRAEYLRRVEAKKENARSSSRKAKANGNSTGPKSKVDWIRAWAMREKYFTKTKIARELGLSRSYVSREFKKRGWK